MTSAWYCYDYRLYVICKIQNHFIYQALVCYGCEILIRPRIKKSRGCWPPEISVIKLKLFSLWEMLAVISKYIFKHIIQNSRLSIFCCEFASRWMPSNFINDKSTLIQATSPSHYLSQCCPKFMLPHAATRPWWDNCCNATYMLCNMIHVIFQMPSYHHDIWLFGARSSAAIIMTYANHRISRAPWCNGFLEMCIWNDPLPDDIMTWSENTFHIIGTL